jgi:hypothetical protein
MASFAILANQKNLDPFALSAGGHYPMDLLQ